MSQNKLKEGENLEIINFRLTKEQKKLVRDLAEKHAKGNLTKWLRAASLNYRPKKSDNISKQVRAE